MRRGALAATAIGLVGVVVYVTLRVGYPDLLAAPEIALPALLVSPFCRLR
jgi:hypothetical protein